MAETTRLKLPLLAAAQAQKHVTVNEALTILDLLTGVIPVLSRALSAPPGGATDGAVYILSAAGTGGWSGFGAKDIAMMIDGGWRRTIPSQGMVAAIADEGGLMVTWNGGAWNAAAIGAIGGSTGSTDNAILRANGTGGATAQGSSATVDDSGNIQANGASFTSTINVSSAASWPQALAITHTCNDSSPIYFGIQKTRAGGPTQANDLIFNFYGKGYDTDSVLRDSSSFGSSISAVGAGYAYGKTSFRTTQADGDKERLTIQSGLQVGAPTGGDKGAGTINAAASIYVNNSALTCMALADEFLSNGTVDLAKWDSLMSDLITPERVEAHPKTVKRAAGVGVRDKTDSEGKPVVDKDGAAVSETYDITDEVPVTKLRPRWDENGNGLDAVEEQEIEEVTIPEQRIKRRHETAHRFAAMLKDGFDPRDPQKYIDYVLTHHALPGMPHEDEWTARGGASDISVDEMQSRSVLAMEMQFIFAHTMWKRIDQLEARVAKLETVQG
jgi:hypothetical protein